MQVNIKGLINQLDSLRERINDLLDNLDSLEELEQEDIEIENVQQYFQNDDTFNLSIALDLLEQADKLDKVLEIVKDKFEISKPVGIDIENNRVSCGCLVQKKDLTNEEYETLKEVLL